MTPNKYNVTAWEGQHATFAARWTTDGAPVDLTGWTGDLVVTHRGVDDTALVTAPVTCDADGDMVATVDDTALPPRGVYAYRLTITDPGSDPLVLLVGLFTVKGTEDV